MRLSIPIFRLKRQARLNARATGVPLNQALDELARAEGFKAWSHLAASVSSRRPARDVLAQLNPGDVMLLGARPGHGKTLLGLELAIAAAKGSRPGLFFTLQEDDSSVGQFLRSLGVKEQAFPSFLTIDTSDDICASYVIDRLEHMPRGAVAVIDYLQLLDQRRSNPEVSDQIRALRNYVRSSGAIIVVLSQISRAFDERAGTLPSLTDVRLPNPLDLKLFTKTCFLHNGEASLEAVN